MNQNHAQLRRAEKAATGSESREELKQKYECGRMDGVA